MHNLLNNFSNSFSMLINAACVDPTVFSETEKVMLITSLDHMAKGNDKDQKHHSIVCQILGSNILNALFDQEITKPENLSEIDQIGLDSLYKRIGQNILNDAVIRAGGLSELSCNLDLFANIASGDKIFELLNPLAENLETLKTETQKREQSLQQSLKTCQQAKSTIKNLENTRSWNHVLWPALIVSVVFNIASCTSDGDNSQDYSLNNAQPPSSLLVQNTITPKGHTEQQLQHLTR